MFHGTMATASSTRKWCLQEEEFVRLKDLRDISFKCNISYLIPGSKNQILKAIFQGPLGGSVG